MAIYDLLKFDWDEQPSTSNHFGTHEYVWYNRAEDDRGDNTQLVLHTAIRSGIAGYARGDFHADVMLMQYQIERVGGVLDPESAVLSVASSDNPEDEETLDMLFGDSWRKFIANIEAAAHGSYAENPPTELMSVVAIADEDEPADESTAPVHESTDDSIAAGSGIASSGQQLTEMINAAAAAASSEGELDPDTEQELDLLYGMSDEPADDADAEAGEEPADDAEAEAGEVEEPAETVAEIEAADEPAAIEVADESADEPADEDTGDAVESEVNAETEAAPKDGVADINAETEDEQESVDDFLEMLRRTHGDVFVDELIARAAQQYKN